MTHEIKLTGIEELVSSQVIEAIERTLQEVKKASQSEWLRSNQVRELLSIGDSTLQNLRITGAIKAYKLSGIWFYKRSEIDAAIEGSVTNQRRA